jgi:ornithine--oxo-acid transaminase
MISPGSLSTTHTYTIRFAPPLVITKADIDWAMTQITQVLKM